MTLRSEVADSTIKNKINNKIKIMSFEHYYKCIIITGRLCHVDYVWRGQPTSLVPKENLEITTITKASLPPLIGGSHEQHISSLYLLSLSIKLLLAHSLLMLLLLAIRSRKKILWVQQPHNVLQMKGTKWRASSIFRTSLKSISIFFHMHRKLFGVDPRIVPQVSNSGS